MPAKQRTGARSRADVTPALRDAIEAGDRETRTLAEMLAVDLGALMRRCVPAAEAAACATVADTAGIVGKMQAGGRVVMTLPASERRRLMGHRSDIVRGWAAYAVGLRDDLDLASRLAAIRPLADDAHMGVREWAWMAVRGAIAADPRRAITLLAPWTDDRSERVRRFASEATRPRGVWCAHIAALTAAPELGLPILAPLLADPATYVQNSVGNWLNDASKHQPRWVEMLVARWLRESPVTATQRIARRALRTMAKIPQHKS